MFTDKNGTELEVGDYIIPDEGMELLIVSVAYVPDFGGECLFGQQVLDPLAFSLLTPENLALQWTKTEPPDQTTVQSNLRIHTIVEAGNEVEAIEEEHPTKIETKEDKEISEARKVIIND